MELGLGFDDNDLLTVEKPKILLTSYNAKICNPEWFLQEGAGNSDKDQATLDKFSGDLYYKISDYNRAIDFYKRSLGGLQSQNRTMRREVTDSLARCYMNTGWIDRALEQAEKVLEDCLTRDQICHGLHLKQLIYQNSGQIREEVKVLYQLIHIHPRNILFWMKLKNVYTRLRSMLDQRDKTHDIPNRTSLHTDTCGTAEGNCYTDKTSIDKTDTTERTSVSINDMNTVGEDLEHLSMSKSTGETSNNVVVEREGMNSTSAVEQPAKNTSDCSISVYDRNTSCDVRFPGDSENKQGLISSQDYGDILTGLPCQLLQLSCCMRIRRILKSVQRTVTSFIKQKNIELQKQIYEEICSLNVDEVVLQRANTCIWRSSDLDDDDDDDDKGNPDKAKGEGVEEKDIPTFTSEEFNKRWFNWITGSDIHDS